MEPTRATQSRIKTSKSFDKMMQPFKMVRKSQSLSSALSSMASKKETNEEKQIQLDLQRERMKRLKREHAKQTLSKAKRAKYTQTSTNARHVLSDLKNTAARHINNVKNSLEQLIAQKLRLKSPKSGPEKSSIYDTENINYQGFENEPRTPVTMYSPFGIETPVRSKSTDRNESPRRPKPSIQSTIQQQRVLFQSPTGKIKQDVKNLTNSLNELCLISADIQSRYSATVAKSVQSRSKEKNVIPPPPPATNAISMNPFA